MPPSVAIDLLVSLAAGLLCIVLGYRLQRRYPLGFLPPYFLFLASSVVYGLFNWTGISWIAEILTPTSAETVKIGLVFATLAFPFLILRVMFLFETVLAWLRISKKGAYRAGIAVFSVALFIPFAVSALNYFARGDIRSLRPMYWIGTAALAAQYLALFCGLLARGAKIDRAGFKALRMFSGISLVCFSVYVVLSYPGYEAEWIRSILPALYFLVLLPPLLYIRRFLTKHAPDFGEIREAKGKLARLGELFDLTPREREVADFLVLGKSYKEIADALFISPHTVKNTTSRIYEKAGVRTRGQLAGRII
jgi:DNA-binding CsgD family transcriptional regulator